MKSLICLGLSFSVILSLSACSKDEGSSKKSSDNPQVEQKNFPNIQAPANAEKEEYSCRTQATLVDQNGATSAMDYTEEGLTLWWESEDQMTESYIDTSTDGIYKVFGVTVKKILSENVYVTTQNEEFWFLDQGQWKFEQEKVTVRTFEKQANGRFKVIKKVVNGVERELNQTTTDFTDLGNNSYKVVSTHKNPTQFKTKDGRTYTSWVQTCIYTKRNNLEPLSNL